MILIGRSLGKFGIDSDARQLTLKARRVQFFYDTRTIFIANPTLHPKQSGCPEMKCGIDFRQEAPAKQGGT